MKNKTGRVVVIQGGQWGSEGKGLVAAHQARVKQASCAVRTGSINAGHTVFYEGREYKMQTIPTAWVVPGVKLYIGPGAYIEPHTLMREIKWLTEAGVDVKSRLTIDYRCFLHNEEALDSATKANRHHAMGATGKGSSEAVMMKLRSRGDFPLAERLLFRNHPLAEEVTIGDVPAELMCEYRSGNTILLEGTQGSHLDLHLGPHPFVTNRGCNSATWFAEAGLPAGLNTETVLVCRTKPIRVAGNSGPMGNETNWPALLMDWKSKAPDLFEYSEEDVAELENQLRTQAAIMGVPTLLDFLMLTDADRFTHRVALSEGPTAAWLALPYDVRTRLSPYVERTTVTNKLRRIADFCPIDVYKACVWNDPTEIVLTFLNYEFPETWNSKDLSGFTAANSRLADLQTQIGIPITWTSTGPGEDHLINLNPV